MNWRRGLASTAMLISVMQILALQRPPGKSTEPGEGMVLAWVSAVSSNGKAVAGLSRPELRIWEDDVEQNIEYFVSNNQPISVGIIPCGGIECADAPFTFLKTTSWAEEYFMLVENPTTPSGGTVLQSFTTDIAKLPRNTDSRVAAGGMSIILDYIKEAANRRKIMLLIGTGSGPGRTDAGIAPEHVLNAALQQEDLQVYAVETSRFDLLEDVSKESKRKVTDPNFAPDFFEAISRATGGRAYSVHRFASEIDDAVTLIAQALEVQYQIGFRSTNHATDGKWRSLRIEATTPAGNPKLMVWTKSGYYASKAKSTPKH